MGKFEDALKARRQNLPMVDIGGIKCMVKPASQKTQSDALLAAVEYYQNNLPRQEMDGVKHVPADEADAQAIASVAKAGMFCVNTNRDVRVWLNAATHLAKFTAMQSLLDASGRLAVTNDEERTEMLEIFQAESENSENEESQLLKEIESLAKWPEWIAKNAAKTTPKADEGAKSEESPNE